MFKHNDRCIEKALPEERLFVLMARDPEAPRTIIHWISRSLGKQPPEKLQEALDCAMKMLEEQPKIRQYLNDLKEKSQAEEKARYNEAFQAGRKAGADAVRAIERERRVMVAPHPDTLNHQNDATKYNQAPIDPVLSPYITRVISDKGTYDFSTAGLHRRAEELKKLIVQNLLNQDDELGPMDSKAGAMLFDQYLGELKEVVHHLNNGNR